MKKLLTFVVLYLSFVNVYSQAGYTVTSNGYSPEMDKTTDGIWNAWERKITYTISSGKDSTVYYSGDTDSIYISSVGYPNNGDLYVPDNEVKMKALWNEGILYFLFQRLDDLYVNGLTESEVTDTTIKEGMDNLDATKIYLYLSNDSSRLENNVYEERLISWIQFVWESDKMQAKLPSGEMVYSYDEYYSQSVQWCDKDYCYAKLSIDLNKLSPVLLDSMEKQIDSINYSWIAFLVESTENDKEIMVDDLYQLQTRSFWGVSIDSNAIGYINKWPWLYFYKDTINQYTTPVVNIPHNFAEVYPNPVNDYFNIRLEEFANIQYTLYDLMGRLVLSGQFYDTSQQIMVDGLCPGSYFLMMRNKTTGSIMNRKILVL